MIDKPIAFEEELINNQFANQLVNQQFQDFKTDHLQTTDLTEHRTRTSSGGSHQLATNFNNRKARHQQPFSRQLSTGGLLTTYSSKLGTSPTSSTQLLNHLAASRSIGRQPLQTTLSGKRTFLSQSTTDTHKLIDNVIDDFIAPEVTNLKQQQQSQSVSTTETTSKLNNIGRKSTLQSGDSSESANQVSRLSSKNFKQQKSGTDESDQSFELRNMNAKSTQKLTQATSLSSGGYENRNSYSAAGGSNSPINSTNRPTTFTLNMPQSVPGSPKESTLLMRQFSDEISLYGTPKEEMPHGTFHGDSRTAAHFMRNQIGLI